MANSPTAQIVHTNDIHSEWRFEHCYRFFHSTKMELILIGRTCFALLLYDLDFCLFITVNDKKENHMNLRAHWSCRCGQDWWTCSCSFELNLYFCIPKKIMNKWKFHQTLLVLSHSQWSIVRLHFIYTILFKCKFWFCNKCLLRTIYICQP